MKAAAEPGDALGRQVLDLVGKGPEAVSAVRAWVRGLADGIAEERLTDVLLVVVELVTNAIEHGGGPRWVGVSRTRSAFRIEVQDSNLGQLTPGVSRFGASAFRGRGLVLVRRMCQDWGVLRDNGSGRKTVWTTVPCPARGDVPAAGGTSSRVSSS